ncbi:hypothetical protein [uncultured Cohaesibacter sp.]|uniref:hypothetical protein n=1 Tax=uncultured Cohaesibacter sp. TaxID=1002546 RepID=UPI0029C897E0|nr:hypothetical protein [uncultured Cohaesibacter sp.]
MRNSHGWPDVSLAKAAAGLWFLFLLLVFCLPVQAIELGRSGILVNPPDRGWKVESQRDANIEVWHLRAKDWDPVPRESGLIAVTISFLDSDPLNGAPLNGMMKKASSLMLDKFLTDVADVRPLRVQSGRFEVAKEDYVGALDLKSAGKKPVSARFMVVRCREGFVMLTAFSLLPLDDEPFAGLLGKGGMLVFDGPGSGIFASLTGGGSGPDGQQPKVTDSMPSGQTAPNQQTPEQQIDSVLDALDFGGGQTPQAGDTAPQTGDTAPQTGAGSGSGEGEIKMDDLLEQMQKSF